MGIATRLPRHEGKKMEQKLSRTAVENLAISLVENIHGPMSQDNKKRTRQIITGALSAALYKTAPHKNGRTITDEIWEQEMAVLWWELEGIHYPSEWGKILDKNIHKVKSGPKIGQEW
jgi:hypothetical protein